jgi:hypothetical protein
VLGPAKVHKGPLRQVPASAKDAANRAVYAWLVEGKKVLVNIVCSYDLRSRLRGDVRSGAREPQPQP